MYNEGWLEPYDESAEASKSTRRDGKLKPSRTMKITIPDKKKWEDTTRKCNNHFFLTARAQEKHILNISKRNYLQESKLDKRNTFIMKGKGAIAIKAGEPVKAKEVVNPLD